MKEKNKIKSINKTTQETKLHYKS